MKAKRIHKDDVIPGEIYVGWSSKVKYIFTAYKTGNNKTYMGGFLNYLCPQAETLYNQKNPTFPWDVIEEATEEEKQQLTESLLKKKYIPITSITPKNIIINNFPIY